jgi:hypothetical protein
MGEGRRGKKGEGKRKGNRKTGGGKRNFPNVTILTVHCDLSHVTGQHSIQGLDLTSNGEPIILQSYWSKCG